MSKLTLEDAIFHCLEVAEEHTKYNSFGGFESCDECAKEHRQLAEWLRELKEAKRLLKAAVEDFAKLDRVNTKVRNCMMPDMDCADCPLSWDSVDDSVEPCHNWRYADEALALIGGEADD